MASSPKNHLFLAFILIFFGFLILLNNLGVTSFDLSISTWWPLVLIIVGLHQLFSSRFTNLFAFILLFLGGAFQLRRLGLISAAQLRLVWPLLLILFGLILLFNFGSGRRRVADTAPENTVDILVIFGDVERRISSPSFLGGNLTALFGGATLDLRGSEMPEGVNLLNIQAIFGGVDLIIPEGWTVEIRGIPIFGGIEDQRVKQIGPEGATGPKLRINAFIFFGGIDVKD
ncbi:MAG: cell wall-active antibiotics response protein [Firmicutes bacterium]|nr:cell wall-active antibiotics response protein [Bacillota bacterium]